MDVEVLKPLSTPWLSKCGPSKYGHDGFADHSRSYVGSTSGLQSVSWLQFAEKEIMKSPKPKQLVPAPPLPIPPMLSSVQTIGKSLPCRVGDISAADNGLYESKSIQWYCDNFEDSSLIPGLPEDVAHMCLALVRRSDFPSVRNVCKAWCDLIQTQEFYITRKCAGTLEEWLYVLTAAPDMKSTRWEVLNPRHNGDWKALPVMPGIGKVRSGTVVVNEKLLIIGGFVVDQECSFASSDLCIYDPVLDKWTKGASMKTGRYEFACGVVDGKVYVVGGHGDEDEALDSVEVYDPEKNEWTETTPLRKPRWGCFAAGVGGKLYVMGGRSTFTLGSARFMDVLDLETGQWQEVKNGCTMVLSHAVVKGKIYCIEWKDERTLRCYNTADNTWSKIVLPIPVKSRSGFCLGTHGGKLQFFPTVKKPNYETLVYDPQAPKGKEWGTTSIKATGACLSCETMTA